MCLMLCPKQQQHPEQHPLSNFHLSTVCSSAIRKQINRTWMDHHDHGTENALTKNKPHLQVALHAVTQHLPNLLLKVRTTCPTWAACWMRRRSHGLNTSTPVPKSWHPAPLQQIATAPKTATNNANHGTKFHSY